MDGEALKKFIGRYKGTADAVSCPLTRPENKEASPVSSAPKQEEKAAQPAPGEKGGPKKETYTGEKVAVKDLGGYSRAEAQAVYNYAGTLRGRGWIGSYSPVIFPPVLTEQKAEEPPKDEAERRKRAYRKNIVTMADLLKPTPKIVRNRNPQGLRRYVFYNEWIACKNGFLYYLIPLLVGVVFLILNLFRHNFLVNAVAAVFALVAALSIWRIAKDVVNVKKFFLNTLIVLLCVVGYILIIKFVPGFAEKVYYPFAIKLVIIVFDVYYCGKFYTYFMLAYAGDCQLDFGNTVRINAGKPRSGKTSNAVHDGRILALKMWERLQYDYKIWSGRESEISKRKDKNELLMYHEIKVSYNFYIMRHCIPCLWSNIGIEDDRGYRCHKITLDHLKGIARLPLYSVVVLDEIGAVLKAELSVDKERPYDVSDMFRLGGHFLKWSVIACEQDFNNIYIDCRRVVGFNQLISGQEWICRPGLLGGIFNALKFFISDSMDKKMKRQPRLSSFMNKFEKFVRSIGFRRYKLAYVSNTQTDAAISGASADQKLTAIGGRGRRIVPASLIARYDDRAYKQMYPSYFDREICGELHEALHIVGTDTKYGRQFVNSSKAIDEKREAVDKLLNALIQEKPPENAGRGFSFNSGGVKRRKRKRESRNAKKIGE